MNMPFGSFDWICEPPHTCAPSIPIRPAGCSLHPIGPLTRPGRHAPLPQCNLFFAQLYNGDPPYLTNLFPNSSDFFSTYDVVSRVIHCGASIIDSPRSRIELIRTDIK
jgi:hypothetical protein